MQSGCRQRSRSIGTEARPLLRASAAASNKRSSCHLQYESRQAAKRHSIAQAPCSPKVSKWTKVKAAFRWERAAATFLEQDRFLRPPAESSGSGPPSPGCTLQLSYSTASSSPSSSTDELCPKLPRSTSRPNNTEATAAPRANVNTLYTHFIFLRYSSISLRFIECGESTQYYIKRAAACD